jgi:hypothetical protein
VLWLGGVGGVVVVFIVVVAGDGILDFAGDGADDAGWAVTVGDAAGAGGCYARGVGQPCLAGVDFIHELGYLGPEGLEVGEFL